VPERREASPECASRCFGAPGRVHLLDGEQGYAEPFPSGVVERPRTLLWEVEWHPVRGVFVTGQVCQAWVQHGGHVLGRQERRTRWVLMATLWGEPVVEVSSR
jgi:hypothetical protein